MTSIFITIIIVIKYNVQMKLKLYQYRNWFQLQFCTLPDSAQFGNSAIFLSRYFASIQLQINCFKKIVVRFDRPDSKLNFQRLFLRSLIAS